MRMQIDVPLPAWWSIWSSPLDICLQARSLRSNAKVSETPGSRFQVQRICPNRSILFTQMQSKCVIIRGAHAQLVNRSTWWWYSPTSKQQPIWFFLDGSGRVHIIHRSNCCMRLYHICGPVMCQYNPLLFLSCSDPSEDKPSTSHNYSCIFIRSSSSSCSSLM